MPARIAFAGDSITAGASSTGWRRAYRDQVLKLLGARMSQTHISAGVGGDRSDQLLVRIPGILAQNPDLVFVMIGTNDAGQGISVENYQSNITAIVGATYGEGKEVVIGLVPPRAAGGPVMGLTYNYNMWLRQWCDSKKIPCADTFTALVDPETGLMAPQYDSGDGAHPNNTGHMALAIAVAKVLEQAQVTTLPVWQFTTAGIGLLTNPLMLNGTTGWEHRAGPYTAPIVIPGEGTNLPAGNWIQFRDTNTTTNSRISTYGHSLGTKGTDWDEGDILLVGAYMNGPGNKVQLLDGSAPVGPIIEQELPSTAYGPLLRTVQIPTGITGILRLGFNLQAPPFSTATLEVGAVDVINLTKLNMTSLPV